MKNLLYLFIASTFLISCSSNDSNISEPEIDTKMKLFFDSFYYQEEHLCDNRDVKLPWKFINGNESLWVDDNYIVPSTGHYNISIKFDAIYYGAFDYGGGNITKRCDLVSQYGIGVGIHHYFENSSGNRGLINSTECNEVKSFNKTTTEYHQKGFVLALEASLISKTGQRLNGTCANI
jgi:hypothetical protein